ncbi:hypothetical protein Nm8I071_12310 [Nonomuraea sp. TT08I-71]|nr:hypothetical protein Nm8I071_12310 [Nonomuraea sp. TT08I-71]
MQGSHHSAQKSTTTGVVSDRSNTSDWKVASVTSMTATPPPAGGPPGTPAGGPAWLGVVGREGSGVPRNALRSTAPRVKIDEVIRGSLMVI